MGNEKNEPKNFWNKVWVLSIHLIIHSFFNDRLSPI